MEIAEETNGPAIVLTVNGRVDSLTAKKFEEIVLGALDRGANALVIDLAAVDFVSSAGLRVFLLAAKRLKGSSGKLALTALQPTVKEVFDVSGFSRIFSILPDRTAGVGFCA